MIASRASWRFAWLAAALLVGVVLAFAQGGASSSQATPELVLPAHERIDDGPRDGKPLVNIDRSPGILEDTPVDQPRHDRGF